MSIAKYRHLKTIPPSRASFLTSIQKRHSVNLHTHVHTGPGTSRKWRHIDLALIHYLNESVRYFRVSLVRRDSSRYDIWQQATQSILKRNRMTFTRTSKCKAEPSLLTTTHTHSMKTCHLVNQYTVNASTTHNRKQLFTTNTIHQKSNFL